MLTASCIARKRMALSSATDKEMSKCSNLSTKSQHASTAFSFSGVLGGSVLKQITNRSARSTEGTLAPLSNAGFSPLAKSTRRASVSYCKDTDTACTVILALNSATNIDSSSLFFPTLQPFHTALSYGRNATLNHREHEYLSSGSNDLC